MASPDRGTGVPIPAEPLLDGLRSPRSLSLFTPPAAVDGAVYKAGRANPRSVLGSMMQAAFHGGAYSVQGPRQPQSPGMLGTDAGTLTGERIDPLTGDRVAGGATNMDDAVYMGRDEHIETFDRGNPDPSFRRKTITVGTALNLPYNWSIEKREDVAKKMRSAGFSIGDQGDTFGDILKTWQSMVERASRTYVLSGGQNAVTPWDMLSLYKRENKDAGILDADGNVVQVEKVKTVNDLTEGQAWNILRQTMQETFGRDPSDDEISEFLSAANADAAANPTMSTRTTTINEAGQTSVAEDVTKGGYTAEDAQKAAYDDMKDDTEYAEYQSATTYFNALVSALGEAAGAS